MTQAALFGELLPTLKGCVQGIVGKRPAEHGQHEWDLQCQWCHAIETVWPLVTMTFKFPPCTETNGDRHTRRRTCPDCHRDMCDGHGSCADMPGMRKR